MTDLRNEPYDHSKCKPAFCHVRAAEKDDEHRLITDLPTLDANGDPPRPDINGDSQPLDTNRTEAPTLQ